MKNLPFSSIRMDGGTQSRVQLNWIVIDEYAKAMMDGAQFPPVVVFYDGSEYWLGDGFHRVLACDKAGIEIEADVREGTCRDAILYSVGANSTHGLPRKPEDRRNAVMMLLNDEEWHRWGDPEIGRRCNVSHMTVNRLRPESIFNIVKDRTSKFNRNGKTHTMDTTNIGKPKPKAKPQPVLTDESPEPEPEQPPAPQPVWQPEPTPTVISNVVIHHSDAQEIYKFNIAPVHLVITSPPYNVGIDYNGASDDLLTYFELITSIWRECYKTMVDGGRIAVVVPFGVGRKPWVPMAAKVADTLTSAGFVLRGQIIWDKNTTGNRTSWGSFRLGSDPDLRDTCEAILVAHKGGGKLDLPDDVKRKDEKGSYTEWLASSEYFMELAQDHWTVQPESAQRIGHPAPFPVELVTRLIHFYAFPSAHILDPFAGSGTVGVAAKALGCDATLFELDSKYCEIAQRRIDDA